MNFQSFILLFAGGHHWFGLRSKDHTNTWIKKSTKYIAAPGSEWIWIDGEIAKGHFNWYAWQYIRYGQTCVFYDKNHSYEWDNASCDHIFKYICEKDLAGPYL